MNSNSVAEPLGVWLYDSDFDDRFNAESTFSARGLPMDSGGAYLVPRRWLDPVSLLGKTTEGAPRKTKKRVRLPSLDPVPDVNPLPSVVLQVEFRKFDVCDLVECTDRYGNPSIALDVAPYVFEVSPRRFVPSNIYSALRDLLEENATSALAQAVRDTDYGRGPNKLILTSTCFESRNNPVYDTDWSDVLTDKEVRGAPDFYQVGMPSKGDGRNIGIHMGNDPIDLALLAPSKELSLEEWVVETTEVTKKAFTDASSKLVQLESRIAGLKREVGVLNLIRKATGREVRSRLESALERISADPRVASCHLMGKFLCLRTNDVYVAQGPSSKKKAFLGEYEFRVSIADGVTVRNLQLPESDDRVHPHGFDSSVCLGSYDVVFNNCFQTFDFYTLLLTLLEWTTDINLDDHRAKNSLGSVFKEKPPKKKRVSPWAAFLPSPIGADLGYESEDRNAGRTDDDRW